MHVIAKVALVLIAAWFALIAVVFTVKLLAVLVVLAAACFFVLFVYNLVRRVRSEPRVRRISS